MENRKQTTPNEAAQTVKSDDRVDGFEPARAVLLEQCLILAPFDGWSDSMLRNAASGADIDDSLCRAAFPAGIRDLLRYWSLVADEKMVAAMSEPGFGEMRIRDKVAGAVKTRIEFMRPDKEAARRAAAVLATPHMAHLGAKLVWNSADAVWRGLDDSSTDFNFYTKRTILSGVISSTMARWFADSSEDESATEAFLAARIENVMQFEKVKAQAKKLGIDPTAPIGWLARLRYPSAR